MREYWPGTGAKKIIPAIAKLTENENEFWIVGMAACVLHWRML